MPIEFTTEEKLNSVVRAIGFQQKIIDHYVKPAEEEYDKDYSALLDSGKYSFSFKDSAALADILKRSYKPSDLVPIDKEDLMIIETYVVREKIKLDKEKVDFEKGLMDPFYVLAQLEKTQKKLENQIRKEAIQAAITKIELNQEEITAKAISDIAEGISEAEAEKYLKRLEAVNKARANNPKIKH